MDSSGRSSPGRRGLPYSASFAIGLWKFEKKVESSSKARKALARTDRPRSDKESIATGKKAYDNLSTGEDKKSSFNRAAANRGPQSTEPRAFMDLIAGSIGGECLIELEGADRARLRIQMKLTAPNVMSLVREWRGGGIEIGKGNNDPAQALASKAEASPTICCRG